MSGAESVGNWNQLLICATLARPHISYGSIDWWANYSGWFLVPLFSCLVSYFLFVHVQIKQRKIATFFWHHPSPDDKFWNQPFGKRNKKKSLSVHHSYKLLEITLHSHAPAPTKPSSFCVFWNKQMCLVMFLCRSHIWLSLPSTASPSPQTRFSAASAVLCNLLKRADRVLGTKRHLQVYIYHYAATCSGIQRLKKNTWLSNTCEPKCKVFFTDHILCASRFEMIIWNALKWALHLKLAAHYVPAHTWMPL